MKPKNKSNAATAVLLFVLCACTTHAAWPPADTIIIDGETIYIEREVVRTNIDSLQSAMDEDTRPERIAHHFFSAAIHAGWNLTMADYATSLNDKQPLDVFIGKKNSTRGNFFAAADMSFRFLQLPLSRGTAEFSAHTGIGYNRIQVSSHQMNEREFERDSLLGLSFIGDQLRLRYFTSFDTIGGVIIGEEDTAIVATQEATTVFRTLDIPLKLRGTWLLPHSSWSVFAEVGIVMRNILQTGSSAQDNYLVGADATFSRLDESDFHTRTLIRPLFSIGTAKRIGHTNEDKNPHWSCGAQMTFLLPPTPLNTGSLYYFDIRSGSLSVFIRRNF